MRPAVRFEPALAALLAGFVVATASPAMAAESQIYQQRAADGRIVLTDRPSATAVTERTWQMEKEDPVAARERARDVQREAEAVSERVQRRMDAQQRLLEAEMERHRRSERELMLARLDDDRDYPALIAAPYPYRGIGRRAHGPASRAPSSRADQVGRPGRFSSPAWPGSR